MDYSQPLKQGFSVDGDHRNLLIDMAATGNGWQWERGLPARVRPRKAALQSGIGNRL